MNDEDRNAMRDAFEDMQEEGDVPAYFGSGVVYDSRTLEADLVNFLIRDAMSYEEAVGIAYLQLADTHPEWLVAKINIDEEIVWAKPDEHETPLNGTAA